MADERPGIVAALADGIGEVLPREPEQLELLDAGPELSMGLEPRGLDTPRRRGKGRRQVEIVDYILSRYRSPLIAAVEMYHRTPEELAREWKLYKFHEGKLVLGEDGLPALDTGAAAKLIAGARDAALPYLHQKLPQAIEVTEKPRGTLTINLGSYAGAVSADLALPISQSVENQRVIEAEPVQSDAAQSDSEGK